jgi:hypothetical protein
MNPNTTLRTWILACGKQFGIRKAFYMRWPDALNRQHEMYATYRMLNCIPDQVGQQGLNSKTGYTVHRKGAQKHKYTCRIDLYNSEDGMYELAAFGVAAHHSPDVRQIFKDHGSMFIEVLEVVDDSFVDDEEILHHQYMICTFTDNVEISLDETNGVVEQINFNLESGSPTHSVSLNKFDAAPDALAATGAATFKVTGPPT